MVEFLIIFAAFFLIAVVNILIYRSIISRTLKKFANPYLNNLGYKVQKTKFPGLLSRGDFEEKKKSFGFAMFNGAIISATYVYLYLENEENKQLLRITLKITTLFLFIRKVEYSTNLKILK